MPSVLPLWNTIEALLLIDLLYAWYLPPNVCDLAGVMAQLNGGLSGLQEFIDAYKAGAGML
jgi:hypothetical protein